MPNEEQDQISVLLTQPRWVKEMQKTKDPKLKGIQYTNIKEDEEE